MGQFGLRDGLTARFFSQLLPERQVAFSYPMNFGPLADSTLRSSDSALVHLVSVVPAMLCPQGSSTYSQQYANENIWIGLKVLLEDDQRKKFTGRVIPCSSSGPEYVDDNGYSPHH